MSYLTRREVEELLRLPPGILAKFILDLDFPKPYRIVGDHHEIWNRDEVERWIDYAHRKITE